MPDYLLFQVTVLCILVTRRCSVLGLQDRLRERGVGDRVGFNVATTC